MNKLRNISEPIIFQQKEIRRVWHKDEWWFSILDIVEVLSDSPSPKTYWAKIKERDNEISQPFPFWEQLKLVASDSKMRETDCVNMEGALRIIQSIPSPKAEPFKRWLAKVGYERIQEIENPELSQERMKKLYEMKGYSQDWIDKRLRGIAIRQNLTDEWKERGVQRQIDFAILTAEISKATFGMTPSEYRDFKSIPKKSKINLRDNMTDLELIFTMLGEKVTAEISKNEKPTNMPLHKKVAKRGGKVAGNARLETERELKRSVISKKNYLLHKQISK